MKKTVFLGALALAITTAGLAQTENIEEIITQHTVEAHLRFLASDELKGRDTGSPELDIAARYIAEYFRSYGLKPVPGADTFFQPVSLASEKPSAEAVLSYQKESFRIGEELLVLSGDSLTIKAPVVYAGHALPEDLEGVDVQGKIVVAKAGTPQNNSPQAAFLASRNKLDAVKSKGGLALVELYRSSQMPWTLLTRYLHVEKLVLDYSSEHHQETPLVWINDAGGEYLSLFQQKKKDNATLSIDSKESKVIPARNVAAMVEGTDPELREQYIILSAHYDHVGVNENASGQQDSIYNGARDNAIGITALLAAARYFGENPPKRSLLFLAVTAEEKGMLGSAWYADHPLVPLEQTVFNLNTDGAGYNDTTKVTIIGLERTSAEQTLRSATQAMGLTPIQDPVPEQNLYDRSDNVSFASKGIPAVDYAPGITAFDQEIMKNYHQVSDEAESLDFNYLEKFMEAYTLAARRIANMEKPPFWVSGDKYEKAGKQLYRQ